MAVQGAHLTSTTATLGDAPSIFEVLAQESLLQSMKPALQHLLRVIAERNPARYGRLYAHIDEVYLLLQFILERYYLQYHSSSFSENFYGMKRVASTSAAKPSQSDVDALQPESGSDTPGPEVAESTVYNTLPTAHRYKSLVFLVLVPYLKSKCDVHYERLSKQPTNSQNPDDSTSRSVQTYLCKAFLGVYPVLHMVWESTMLACQMAYIFDKSRVHSPFLTWAGVLLCNLTEGDYSSVPPSPPFTLSDKSWTESVALVSSKLFSGLAVSLSTGLSVGVFFLQFLEWWYASDQKASTLTALPNPPPPQVVNHPSAPGLHTVCPLCQRVRTNDTALAVSGFVFCYSCIKRYISEKGCCPVTKYPSNTDHLIRLYLPDS